MTTTDSSACDAAVDRVLASAEEPRLVFQPIVDLQRGTIAGYEALSRFTGPPRASPDLWFAAAARRGRGVELELRALRLALTMRARLPADTFLCINLSPAALQSPDILDSEFDLRRVVFELTERDPVADYDALKTAVARVRLAGGLIAVDDTGAGFASLRHVLELRPQFVKLDRELIRNIDDEPAKRAAVRMLGDFASRIDAWIVAEGIETQAELDALTWLRVPLGQGFCLARPGEAWAPVDASAKEQLSASQRHRDGADRVVGLVEPRPTLQADASPEAAAALFAEHEDLDAIVVLDELRRPVGLRRRHPRSTDGVRCPVLVVAAATEVREAGRRASARDLRQRLDPLACCDPRGEYVGVVTVERLLECLAQ